MTEPRRMIVHDTAFVSPDRLLLVRYRDPDGTQHDLCTIVCQWVPTISATGKRGVAIEIVFDPGVPNPTEPYYCPTERLRRELLSPLRVDTVGPYQVQAGEAGRAEGGKADD